MRDRRSPPEWNEVRIGLGLMAALGLVALGIFFLDRIRREIAEGPTVVVLADDAAGLEPGAEVWVAGRRGGRVRAVRLVPPAAEGAAAVVVEAVLLHEAASFLRADASAEIAQAGLLGPAVLAIRPGGEAARRFDFRDTLRAPGVPPRERVMAALDTFRATLRRSEPTLRAATRLWDGQGTLPALRMNPEPLERLGADVRRLADLLQADAGGSAGRLARDTAWRAALRRVGARMRSWTAPPPEAAARPPEPPAPTPEAPARAEARPEPRATLAELDVALERLRATIGELEAHLAAGGGTAGRALHDDEIRRQAALLRARIDTVRAELVAEPLRWLRFRLF